MKYLRYAVMVVVTLAAIIFAIANRATASVDLWPLPLIIDLPVYVLGLGGLALGFLIGVFLTGVGAFGWRMKAADRLRRAERAETQAESLGTKVKAFESKVDANPSSATEALPAPAAPSLSGPRSDPSSNAA